ncbi:MAG TPA: DUF4160 domain-containing protein [Longimicrobiaceae bacterium]|nr:DUF4160 domain-containing protein [Longimicrobiaceae bacterium]
MIFPNDHRPPHVHVFDADGSVIVMLDPLEAGQAFGMKRSKVVKAVQVVGESREVLLKRWRKIHG